eukprot:TRINITY_DN3592_c1_g1_i2.p1 TRINITY_DN3592_c1_g1~~TRINITY_DN3592_c1_g1_i2.p1  ORF type:complete len:128 (+),score=27.81 TRINITY_DN3592_c1_g1_i2:60-443(+)
MSIHDANEVVPFITGTDLIKPELSGKRVCIAGTVIAHDAVSNVVQAEDSDHKLFEVRLSPGFSASHHMLFSGTLHPGHAGSACLATIICDGFSCYVTDMNTQLIDALKETIAINRRYPELFGNPIHG